MAGSLQRPPLKTPSHCIRRKIEKINRPELLDYGTECISISNCNCNNNTNSHTNFSLQLLLKHQNLQSNQYHRRQYLKHSSGHSLLLSQQRNNYHYRNRNLENRKKLLLHHQQNEGKRKLLKYFPTFHKLSNGGIPFPNGGATCNVTAIDHVNPVSTLAPPSATCREYVLEASLQITSTIRQATGIDDDAIPQSLVNHYGHRQLLSPESIH